MTFLVYACGMTEEDYIAAIDHAIVKAGQLMDMADAPDDEGEYESMFEDRFHCGTCVTRTVMETVWPSIQSYIDWLKDENSAV